MFPLPPVHSLTRLGLRDRDEEHGDVVADDVPIALLGVELHGEAAHVSREVSRAFISCDRRETHEGGRLLARALEETASESNSGNKPATGKEKTVIVSYRCANPDCDLAGVAIPYTRTLRSPDGNGRVCARCQRPMKVAETINVSARRRSSGRNKTRG